MSPWAGIIGKCIEFIVKELASKSLHPDKKEQACRSFRKLYFAIQQLEEITAALQKELGAVVDGNQFSLSEENISDLSERIDLNTRLFIDCAREVQAVLDIYDPNLRKTLSQLSFGKGAILELAATSLRLPNKYTGN